MSSNKTDEMLLPADLGRANEMREFVEAIVSALYKPHLKKAHDHTMNRRGSIGYYLRR